MENYPRIFYVTATLVVGLFAELWHHRSQPWVMPAFMIYTIVVVWYYLGPIFDSVEYKSLPTQALQYSYTEVTIFVISFRLLVPHCSRYIAPTTTAVPRPLSPEVLLPMAVILWFVLFVCAIARMDWDILNALLPLDSRAGNQMWSRAGASDAGPTGFLVATGGYVYLAVCSFFGILAILLRKTSDKLIAGAMMLLTWPAFLLSGTRSAFLVVSVPWVLGYLIFGRQPKLVRYLLLGVAFLCLNFAFKVVASHRNVGFRDYLAGTEDVEVVDANAEVGHEGLNMTEELCYINIFQITGRTQWTWGEDYLTQLLSIVPRAIWPGKPLMGIEYAKLRGFGGGDNDLGVVATLSTGLIGQGVLEYGPIFGSMAPALLMALWCGLLARWWRQRASILRLGLFLLAVGITFNLGRNITSITLWPVLFAYLGVRLLEKSLPHKHAPTKDLRRRPTGVTVKATPRRPRQVVRPEPVADVLGQP